MLLAGIVFGGVWLTVRLSIRTKSRKLGHSLIEFGERRFPRGDGIGQWRRFLLNGGGRGSRDRAPGQGVGEGRSPPEAEKKLNFDNTKPF